MRHELNLARKPFLNPRPVLRVTILLWALGAVVAVFNARLYVSHYVGSSEVRERQQQLEASLDRERREVRERETELERYDLARQNEQSAFLNAKIAERSFSWSTLFDRLGEVMPADVRLTSLSPSFGSESRRGREQTRDNEVLLGVRGMAQNSAVMLEFIDSLFSHPSFRAPNLTSESLQDRGLIDFSLSVIYEARQPPAAAATETTAEAVAPEAATAAPAAPAAAAESGGAEAGAEAPAGEGGRPAEPAGREGRSE